jgi:seryl-tRNA synthetase
MLDIDILRKTPEKVREALEKRGKDTALLDQFRKLDDAWRAKMQESEQIRVEQKKAADERDKEKGKRLKEDLKTIEETLEALEKERYELLLEFPNIPFDDVPVGKDESENKPIRTWGDIPKFDFELKDHVELGEKLGIIDVQKASEVSGSRFYYLKGAGALLEFALLQFVVRKLTEKGFEAVIPPVMVKPEIMTAMGKSKFMKAGDAFHITEDDLYLVGSAEHTMGPLHMNETISEAELPKRYVGFSTSFRREAGTYGKDTRGILRVHQFDKVEMFSFADPKKSEEEHQFLLSVQEEIFQELGVPYQVIPNCTGDMDVANARQYDLEAWLPAQNTYREITSCSNTTDYQTRGIRAKLKRPDGKTEFAHALNATGAAMGRTIIAILENNQRADGSVAIPEALWPYLPGGMKEIK